MRVLQNIDQLFEIFSAENPNPTTELQFTNDYTFLIAIILSARATDKHVNKCTPSLFRDVSHPKKMVEIGEAGLEKYVKTIGLWRNKSKNIVAMSEILCAKYNGEVPQNFDDLLALPGVGRKSANVFLNNFYEHKTIGVDTHVSRVANRLGLSKSAKPEKIEQDLLKIIPDFWQQHAHNWMVLHGRYVCKAIKPNCVDCKVQQFCEFYLKK